MAEPISRMEIELGVVIDEESYKEAEERLVKINRDTRMADGTATAIERHGHPKWWARCGREGQVVSPSVLNTITQKLEDLNSKNDIATQYDVAIQALDTGGVGNVQAYQDALDPALLADRRSFWTGLVIGVVTMAISFVLVLGVYHG